MQLNRTQPSRNKFIVLNRMIIHRFICNSEITSALCYGMDSWPAYVLGVEPPAVGSIQRQSDSV